MKRQLNRNQERLAHQRALLVALSDDLALPLLQVKSSIELAIDSGSFKEHAKAAQLNTEAGLLLVEAYRLLLKSEEIINSVFKPVAIGAVLEEVAHRIGPYAKQYSTEITVDVQGRFAPILAHQPSLAMALEVLSSSLIRAQAAQDQQKIYRIVLGAHRSTDGAVAAGVFSNIHGLSDKSLRAARSLVGHARQPLPMIPPGTASGILVADMLCTQLWQPLRTAAHRSLGGLATNLPLSKQLQFI